MKMQGPGWNAGDATMVHMVLQDKLASLFYAKLFDRYERLLPSPFLAEAPVPKDSAAFRSYIALLDAYAETLKKTETKGALFRRRLQERRLLRILRAAEKTAWWPSRFAEQGVTSSSVRTLEEFERIPPVDRFDLSPLPKEDLLTVPEHDPSIVWRRSGGSTTGTPFVWGLNKTVLIVNVMAHFVKELRARGYPLSERAAENFYLEFNYPHGSFRSEFKHFSTGDFAIRGGDFEQKVRSFAATLDALDRGVVRTISSELVFLVGELRALGLRPPIGFFSLTGQLLEEEAKRDAMEYLDCEVMMHYGAQEMGPLSLDCPDHHGMYHLFSERVIVEVVDERGRSVNEGEEGLVTVTCLDNTVMPLIRYQPGDIGVLRSKLACSCGNTSPLLEIRSRTTDVFEHASGEKKPVSPLTKLFNREPFFSSVRRFQIRQESPERIRILLETRKPLSKEALDALKMRIPEEHRALFAISIEEVGSIEQDTPKFKMFVPLKK